MKRIALLMVLLIGLAVTSAARSQTTTREPTQPTTRAADSVPLKLSPDLQKALDGLAAAVQTLVIKVATDPAIKVAAIHVASGVVTTAQQVVAEQSVVIEEALKKAAERISAQATPRETPKTP